VLQLVLLLFLKVWKGGEAAVPKIQTTFSSNGKHMIALKFPDYGTQPLTSIPYDK
jgi:hypothetical protein